MSTPTIYILYNQNIALHKFDGHFNYTLLLSETLHDSFKAFKLKDAKYEDFDAPDFTKPEWRYL